MKLFVVLAINLGYVKAMVFVPLIVESSTPLVNLAHSLVSACSQIVFELPCSNLSNDSFFSIVIINVVFLYWVIAGKDWLWVVW